MNKHESKYFNTALIFNETLINLLEKKDIEYITIKEICEKSGFNRSTFYLHYDTIYDLLDETLENIINNLVKQFNKNPKNFINNLDNLDKNDLMFINKKYLKPYLEFIKENKKVFITAFKRPNTLKCMEIYSNLEKYIINPILDKYKIDNFKKKYLIEFYLNGITGIIKEWTLNNCLDNIEDIIDIIIECVRPYESN